MNEPTSAERDARIVATLGPPGAGVGFVPELLLRFVMKPWVVRRAPWEASEVQFARAHARLKEALLRFEPQRLQERVLVPPQRGLEDSSRYWSAAMLAEHVTLVGSKICQVIIALSRGQVPAERASTAAVKPAGAIDNAVEHYVAFGDAALADLHRGVQDRTSRLTHAHPWFGPMTAKDWLWLLGAHTSVHGVQLARIRRGLSQQGPV